MTRVTCQTYNQTRQTALRNATERVDAILEDNDPHPLSPEQEAEIARIVADADDRRARD